MNPKLSQRRTGRATARPLKAYMSETLTETQPHQYQPSPEEFSTIGGERRLDPGELYVIGNKDFLRMVSECQESTRKTFDDQAVCLLNSILMGNPNVMIQLEPHEQDRHWVTRFRNTWRYKAYDENDKPIGPGEWDPRTPGGVMDRLVFATEGAEIESVNAKPQRLVSAGTFYDAVSKYSRENRTSFDFEALETLKALLETQQGNIVITLPEYEENTPWLQAFRKHCKKTNSTADSRIITYNPHRASAPSPTNADADSRSSLMHAA